MRSLSIMISSAMGLGFSMGARAEMIEQDEAVKCAIDKVHTFFEAQKIALNIPGLSYVIVHGDKVLAEKNSGYMDIENRKRTDHNTLYRIGSITKVVTATMLAQLQERGMLQLDDPVQKYVPDFHVSSNVPDSKPITLRQLASHTSGLPAEAPLDHWQTLKFPSEKELLESIDGIKLKHPQLTKMYYSNLGFSLLGIALSRVSGKGYADYLASEIFAPLGMTSTSLVLSEVAKEDLAKGYVWDGSKHVSVPNFDMEAIAPAGAVYSTPRDMARFISLQFAGYRSQTSSEAPKVLSSVSLREMHSPVYINDNWSLGIGVGWFIKRINDRKAIYHAGGLPGYTSDVTLMLDRELGIALFTNSAVDTTKLNKEAMEMLLPAFDAYFEKEENQMAGIRPEWNKLIGKYSLPGGLPPSRVFFNKNRMWLATPATPAGSESVFFPTEDEGRFVLRRGDLDGEEVVFKANSSGIIEGMEIAGYILTRIEK